MRTRRIGSRLFVCIAIFAVACVIGPTPAQATTCTWKGGTGDWFVDTNWTNGIPGDGADAIINTGSVLLTNFTSNLASFTMTNATLTFSNWTTKLTASNVVINGGTITLPAAFTNNGVSNRVWVVCTNFFLATAGKIDADSKGFKGGIQGQWPGNGPGSSGRAGAASYGGRGAIFEFLGATANPLYSYGSLTAPIDPGSGAGGWDNSYGGNGGGAVRIEAAGVATINGTITANASGPGNQYGGGSGGGIYISCNTFAGTNGIILANGADASQTGGGGGRIAIVGYDANAQQAMPKPSVLFSAARGTSAAGFVSDMGTVYFPDSRLLNPTWLPHTGRVWMASSSWTVSSLIVSNGNIRFPMDGFQLTVSNNAMVTGPSGNLQLGGNGAIDTNNNSIGTYQYIYTLTNGPTFTVGGNLILTNGGCLTIYAGVTNAATSNYSALVDVTGDIFIDTNSWLYPHSQPYNGGSPLLRMGGLTIVPTVSGGISASYRGFRKGTADHEAAYGPGAGGYMSGGGYGGKGGYYSAVADAGPTYGASNAPIDPGSGGYGKSGWAAGNGGGLIRIQARALSINGKLVADGEPGAGGTAGAGGAGGGIYLICSTFAGNSTGFISAKGGASASTGGGGGGRVCILRVPSRDTYQGSNSVTGGTGSNPSSSNGTFVILNAPEPAGLMLLLK